MDIQEAWQPGKLFYPIENYTDIIIKNKSELNISIMHHPFNWFDPENARELSVTLEAHSNIIFTGHEHVTSKAIKSDFESNVIEYIEGGVLQETGKNDESEFNSVIIDFVQDEQKIIHYKWNGYMYREKNETGWAALIKDSSKLFNLNDSFRNKLIDAGASFTHPRHANLKLNDVYIFPNLRDIKYDSNDSGDSVFKDVFSSDNLRVLDKNENMILIVGSEKSGKSALCKMLYFNYYNKDYVPVYIGGECIRSFRKNKFDRLLAKSFKEQYDQDSTDKFQQLERGNIVLLIDDFEKAQLNLEHKEKFIKAINKVYKNTIITVNDIFLVEEVLSEDEKEATIFESYNHYEVLKFGHILRNSLINNWNMIGCVETIEADDLTRKNDNAVQIIDTIIGNKFVPAYPLFLLIVLQTIESGTQHNLKESSYGYYYNLLIIKSLSTVAKRHDEMDAIDNYITELAYFLFVNNMREISIYKYEEFHEWICDEYKINMDFNKIRYKLNKALVVENTNDRYKFKYPYVRYYFVAKYLSNNMSDKKTKSIISEMCKRLFINEFANIIMFLTYHSKDPFILDEILSNAKQLFPNSKPITLENDTQLINNLVEKAPDFVLQNKSVNEHREEKLKLKDEMELIANDKASNNNEYDLYGDIVELEMAPKINLAFKTIEILGQILRNYYGSLKGEKKLQLGNEAYLLGLRSLKQFIVSLESNSDFFIHEVQKVLEKKSSQDKEQSEKIAKRMVFHISSIISYIFIKKISSSVGTENLKETFKQILENNQNNSTKLIDMSIKLDYYRVFPYTEIAQLEEDTKSNILPNILLKYMAIEYLYMFPTNYKTKQRICETLGISMKAQRVIDRLSSEKKMTK